MSLDTSVCKPFRKNGRRNIYIYIKLTSVPLTMITDDNSQENWLVQMQISWLFRGNVIRQRVPLPAY